MWFKYWIAIVMRLQGAIQEILGENKYIYIYKEGTSSKWSKDNEIEKKVSTKVRVCGIENSSSHLKSLLEINVFWKLKGGVCGGGTPNQQTLP